jgi:hypothetical protein
MFSLLYKNTKCKYVPNIWMVIKFIMSFKDTVSVSIRLLRRFTPRNDLEFHYFR